ncbi:hypothetical protein RR48_03740 [Papilio machaon]|uniref:Kazal-like domain-containing protein n=1 Tax=Papilio machaon TaxID=76193 RepID=A0A0N1I843_PAPMA|nr:hypothetical protein RR48_03740 [Papilio machaon]
MTSNTSDSGGGCGCGGELCPLDVNGGECKKLKIATSICLALEVDINISPKLKIKKNTEVDADVDVIDRNVREKKFFVLTNSNSISFPLSVSSSCSRFFFFLLACVRSACTDTVLFLSIEEDRVRISNAVISIIGLTFAVPWTKAPEFACRCPPGKSVCSSNLLTYDGICNMTCASKFLKQKLIMLEYIPSFDIRLAVVMVAAESRWTTPPTGYSCMCPPGLPVCASNLVTYLGICNMQCAQHWIQEKLFVIYNGDCNDIIHHNKRFV